MAHLLDTQSTYTRLDPTDARASMMLLAEQCLQGWSETGSLALPASYKKLDRIAVVGMGGSGLGTHLLRSVFAQDLKVPLKVLNDYTLPAWVNRRTLVLVVTYSGGTEESLHAFKEAKTRGAKLVAITSGGKLAAMAKRANIPAYIFNDTKTNPSGAPRMGMGLSLFSELRILKELGYLTCSQKTVHASIQHMMKVSEAMATIVPRKQNAAKQLALALKDTVPLYLASEHLNGNARMARNQTHETAKCYSEWYAVPELNHHLMEAFAHPKNLTTLSCVQFLSKRYHKRNQKRHDVLQTILKKNKLKVHRVTPEGSSLLEEALWTLQFTTAVTYYLGMLYNVDPANIPWVDLFKKQLA